MRLHPGLRAVTPEQERDLLSTELYRALQRWDREKASARGLRMALGGWGPRIVRGTQRGALSLYLTEVVQRTLREAEAGE